MGVAGPAGSVTLSARIRASAALRSARERRQALPTAVGDAARIAQDRPLERTMAVGGAVPGALGRSAGTTAAEALAEGATAGRHVETASVCSRPAMGRTVVTTAVAGPAAPAQLQRTPALGVSAPVSPTARGRTVVRTDVGACAVTATTSTTIASMALASANPSVTGRPAGQTDAEGSAGSVVAARSARRATACSRPVKTGRAGPTAAEGPAAPVPVPRNSATRVSVSVSLPAMMLIVARTGAEVPVGSVPAGRVARREPAPSRPATV